MVQNLDLSEEHLFGIALGLIPGIGSLGARRLIREFGSATAIFKADRRSLRKALGRGQRLAASFGDPSILKRAEKEIAFCERRQISVHLCHEPDFPRRLLFCPDAPYILFTKGPADLNALKMIAVVGTRRATGYGKQTVDKILSEISGHGISVISGLAAGIDGAAHRASLNHGMPTIGVVGHGMERMYPASHKALSQQMIAEGGAVVTEFISESPVDRYNFPSRNRIIAGMADAIVVVESADKGGALITADIAHSYDREVFTIPGRISDRYSAGCNQLIKSHKAILVESGSEILDHMGWTPEGGKAATVQRLLFPELPTDEEEIVLLLQQAGGPVHIDIIEAGTSADQGLLLRSILSLELKGIVRSLPGNRYELS